jgi:CheY-specific phosphatase CheX
VSTTALQPERELAVFIDLVSHYFLTVGGSAPEFLAATLETSLPAQLDWTGYMPVTGRLTGWISLSFPVEFLDTLLGRMGEDRRDQETRLDLVAEITGTVTSNAREHFGERFCVHPPLATSGRDFPAELVPPPLSFRLPFSWSGREAFLLVAMHP